MLRRSCTNVPSTRDKEGSGLGRGSGGDYRLLSQELEAVRQSGEYNGGLGGEDVYSKAGERI